MREILYCDTAVERNYLFLYKAASRRELQTSTRWNPQVDKQQYYILLGCDIM